MINTHGDFYYVLGKSDKFDSGYSYASGFYNTTFAGGTTITNPVGSMFCIWCDYPNAETETVVAQKTRLVLRAMAARMDNKSIDTISKAVVANGFNEDGTLNNAGTEFKIVDCEGGSTPTLEVGKALTLCIANGASAKWSASPADIVQIEVSDSANANGSVSGSSVKVTALKAGEVTITATNPENESQTATFALTVSDPDAPRTETVTLTVGSTKNMSWMAIWSIVLPAMALTLPLPNIVLSIRRSLEHRLKLPSQPSLKTVPTTLRVAAGRI